MVKHFKRKYILCLVFDLEIQNHCGVLILSIWFLCFISLRVWVFINSLMHVIFLKWNKEREKSWVSLVEDLMKRQSCETIYVAYKGCAGSTYVWYDVYIRKLWAMHKPCEDYKCCVLVGQWCCDNDSIRRNCKYIILICLVILQWLFMCYILLRILFLRYRRKLNNELSVWTMNHHQFGTPWGRWKVYISWEGISLILGTLLSLPLAT